MTKVPSEEEIVISRAEPPSHQQKGEGRKTKQTQLDNNNDQQQVGESKQFFYDSNLECKWLSLVNKPNNFYAGKVKQNVDKWKTITRDKSILDVINSYQLNLPPTRNNCNNPAFNEHEKTTIALEFQFFF